MGLEDEPCVLALSEGIGQKLCSKDVASPFGKSRGPAETERADSGRLHTRSRKKKEREPKKGSHFPFSMVQTFRYDTLARRIRLRRAPHHHPPYRESVPGSSDVWTSYGDTRP